MCFVQGEIILFSIPDKSKLLAVFPLAKEVQNETLWETEFLGFLVANWRSVTKIYKQVERIKVFNGFS